MVDQATDPVLDVVDLTVDIGGNQPVKGASFSLDRGRKIGLVGESGSGKSLTALSIMRLARYAKVAGRVLLEGNDVLRMSARQMDRVRGGQIAMIYQDPMSSLNPAHPVGHQLSEAIRLHSDVSRAEAMRRSIELLDEVQIPSPEKRVRQYQHEFSGGMRQRVMIAMAMSANPKVLIADEPTTALDVTTQAKIIDLLDRLAAERRTAVVLITHDLGVAAGFCEHVHVMRQGRIVEAAPVDEFYRAPQHNYSKALLSAVIDLRTDVSLPIRTTDDVLDDVPADTETDPSPLSTPTTSAEPVRRDEVRGRVTDEVLLRVDGLRKTYRLASGELFDAVQDASFEIRRGETFGLVGESGSGKSTMARALLALSGIDAGTVQFDGQDVHRLPPRELRRLRARMQVVFQDPYSALNRRHTVSQIVAAPLVAHGIGDRTSRADRIEEVLGLVGLGPEYGRRFPKTLSGGQCQRVALARALVLNPEFVVLDESVSSLDVSIQAKVLNLLRDLQQRLGLTYLFISHDLAVVRYMAQQVAVMQRGVIVENASRDELFSDPKHEYTRSLMAAIPIADPAAERKRRGGAPRSALLAGPRVVGVS